MFLKKMSFHRLRRNLAKNQIFFWRIDLVICHQCLWELLTKFESFHYAISDNTFRHVKVFRRIVSEDISKVKNLFALWHFSELLLRHPFMCDADACGRINSVGRKNTIMRCFCPVYFNCIVFQQKLIKMQMSG